MFSVSAWINYQNSCRLICCHLINRLIALFPDEMKKQLRNQDDTEHWSHFFKRKLPEKNDVFCHSSQWGSGKIWYVWCMGGEWVVKIQSCSCSSHDRVDGGSNKRIWGAWEQVGVQNKNEIVRTWRKLTFYRRHVALIVVINAQIASFSRRNGSFYDDWKWRISHACHQLQLVHVPVYFSVSMWVNGHVGTITVVCRVFMASPSSALFTTPPLTI